MLQKEVLGSNANSSTVLVKDTEAGGELRVVKRINVTSWAESDVDKTLETYNAIASANIPNMVKLYVAMRQSSSISVVSSYCLGEELQEYLDEKISCPLDEVTALRWMRNIARVVQQVHNLPLNNRVACFHGPLIDRIFVVDDGKEVCVGLPLPRVLYFKWLEERETYGVKLHHEYPPEVLRGRYYYTQASDIWQLGLVGMKLLAANASFDRRSAVIRTLIASMMNPIMRKRPNIEEVNRKLGEITRERSISCLSSADVNTPTSYERFLTPRSAVMEEPIGMTSLDEYDTFTTDLSKTNFDEVTQSTHKHAWRNRLQPSWYNQAMKQFEELQRMNSTPLTSRSRPASPTPATGGAVSPRARRDAKATNARDRSGGARPSPRRRASSSTLTGPQKNRTLERVPSSARRDLAMPRMLNNIPSQRSRNAHRLELEEKKRRQQALEREAHAMHRVHENRMREIRKNQDESMKHDIRKYIKQWREQSTAAKDDSTSYSEHNGVAIFVPKNPPPPGRSPNVDTKAKQQPLNSEGDTHRRVFSDELTHAAAGPVVHGSTPRPYSATRHPRTPPSATPKRSASIYRIRGISPKVPHSRANPSDRYKVTESAPTTTVSCANPSSSKNSGTTAYQTSETSSGTYPSGTNRAGQSNSRTISVLGEDATKPSCTAGVPGTNRLAAESLRCSAGRLREALEKLLPTRELFVETMEVVDAFVVRSEIERCNPRFNTVFMHTLRKLMNDDELLLSAVPMCAQLVSLLSLLQGGEQPEGT